MKNLVLIAAAALAFAITPATADVAPAHAAVIEKMLTVMQVDKQYEANTINGFEAGLGLSSEKIQAMPPEQQEKFQRAIGKVKTMLLEYVGWEKVKGDMVALYAKVYTEKEAAEVIALMDTPAGQMMATKQVTLIGDVMKMNTEKMKALVPAITRIMQVEMSK